MKQKCNVIGLTGGIGSGKSTVSKFFVQYNIPVIDLDQISQQVVLPNTEGLEEIISVFGNDYLNAKGELNRSKLKQLIFSNPLAKKQLENILHPLIEQKTLTVLKKLKPKHSLIIIEIPLLAEKGKPDYVDHILVCDCSESLQIERVMQRDNVSNQEVLNIIKQQATRTERLAIADSVINTEKSLNDVSSQVKVFLAKELK